MFDHKAIDLEEQSSEPPLATTMRVPDERLSADGRLALSGLLRELRELGPPRPDEMPGLRGDDDWYR
jgi:hypothetical protein